MRTAWLAAVATISLVDCWSAMPVRAADGAPTREQLDFFERKIRPVLVERCYECHSATAKELQGQLALDTREGLFSRRNDGVLIVPGRLEASLLWQRLTHADRDVRMPPAAAERTLTRRELDVIRRWIAAGAEWEDHWAFIPPRRPPVPAIVWEEWPRTAVDSFLFAALTERGLPTIAVETGGARSNNWRLYSLLGIPSEKFRQEWQLRSDHKAKVEAVCRDLGADAGGPIDASTAYWEKYAP